MCDCVQLESSARTCQTRSPRDNACVIRTLRAISSTAFLDYTYYTPQDLVADIKYIRARSLVTL